MRRRSRRGQATTEYFVLVAVLVVGLVAAAYAFLPGFQQGIAGLSSDAGTLFAAGTQDGRNDRR
jgi:hypothetical protein